MIINVDDVREYDDHLKREIARFKTNLKDLLAPHRLTLAEARVHKVLIPMVGVYTPGWQALPAASWEYVELVTEEGPIGTGEWPIDLDDDARGSITRLRDEPGSNLLDLEFEEPLFIAWWDLVGQVLDKPLHVLWAELFERGFEPPTAVSMAAYTWQRFPDANGNNAVTYETWPDHAAERARQGFPSIKVSMSSYQPEDHIDLVHRIRKAVGDGTAIRIDAHGTWNAQEARRILPSVEECNLEYIEQPLNSMLPQNYYPRADEMPERPPKAGGFQAEYYFREMTDLRRRIDTPLSCHWWTPPIIHPPGASVISNQWEPHWYMLERHAAADVSVPDIFLGTWGLWRISQLAKFMGMHVTVHSNFELCMQLSFRSAMVSALVSEPESAGLYMGTTPRILHPIDNETIQVSDDVIEGGQFDWTGGHLQLNDGPATVCASIPNASPASATPRKQPRPIAITRRRSTTTTSSTGRAAQASLAGQKNSVRRPSPAVFPYSLGHILDPDAGEDSDLELNC